MATTRFRPFSAPVLALVGSLLATACGGGDSGGGAPARLPAPTTPATITATNGALVAAGALEIAMGGLSLPLVPGVGLNSADGASPPRVLSRIAPDAYTPISRASRALTAAVQSQPCAVSGSVTVSDSPTSVTITFAECSDYEGEVMDGTMGMSGFAQTGDAASGSASGAYTLDLTVTDPATTLRLLGDMHFEETWTLTSSSSLLTGSYFGFSDGVTTQGLSDFSVSESIDETTGLRTSSSSFTLASTEIGGVVTVFTSTPFRSYPFHSPHEGALVVTGAGGGAVRLTVLGDDAATSPQVRIEIDANGDGVFEEQLYRDWSELAAG